MTNSLKPAVLGPSAGVRVMNVINDHLTNVAETRVDNIEAAGEANRKALAQIKANGHPDADLAEASNGKVLNISG